MSRLDLDLIYRNSDAYWFDPDNPNVINFNAEEFDSFGSLAMVAIFLGAACRANYYPSKADYERVEVYLPSGGNTERQLANESMITTKLNRKGFVEESPPENL